LDVSKFTAHLAAIIWRRFYHESHGWNSRPAHNFRLLSTQKAPFVLNRSSGWHRPQSISAAMFPALDCREQAREFRRNPAQCNRIFGETHLAEPPIACCRPNEMVRDRCTRYRADIDAPNPLLEDG
jgi:hypothetical protein